MAELPSEYCTSCGQAWPKVYGGARIGPFSIAEYRECEVSVPRRDLAEAAAAVMQLAQLNGQEVPEDIKAFFARIRS